MNETGFLKLVLPPEKAVEKGEHHSDPLFRFSQVVLNLTSSALDCLNRISRREMEKDSPSFALLEEYHLLHHYLEFTERLCREKKA